MMTEVEKMDDLEFRRAIYADPNNQDEALHDAAKDVAGRQEFWAEMKKLDANLQAASKVNVPDELASKLIMRQSMARFAEQKKRNRIHLAMAASVAFVAGISFTLWQQPETHDMSGHALSHVHYTADHELHAQGDLPLQVVNAKMTELVGAHFNSDIGRVYSANYCEVDNVRTLHLVLQGDNGRITLFITPKIEGNEPHTFSDESFTGKSLDYQQASLIMVGEDEQSFAGLEKELKQKLVFSI